MRPVRFVTLTLLLVAGCDAGTPDNGPVEGDSITGTWDGIVPSRNLNGIVDTLRVAMIITQHGSDVTGNGTVSGPSGQQPFSVSSGGSYFHPLLSLPLTFSNPPPGDLKGNVGEDQMSFLGTMSGPGFSGTAKLRKVLGRGAP